MANKELTAKVKFDTSSAESKLKRLNDIIKSINKAVTGQANTNKLETSLMKQVIQAEKAEQATLKTAIAREKLNQETAKSWVAEEKVNQALNNTAVSQERVSRAKSKTTQEIAKEFIAEEKVNQALTTTAISQERLKQAVSKTTREIAKEFVAEEKVNQALANTAIKQEQVKQAASKTAQEIGKEWVAEERVNQALIRTEQLQNRTKAKTTETTNSTRLWSNAVNDVNKGLSKSSSHLGMITGKLKNLINTYLGVMGMKGIINTSDMITSAENKLNYVSAQQLGKAGYTTDASGNEVYSTATLNATQGAMDKMYASSQKVRMGYTDMMANVSKSMALAGDAFNNNTDMAIRFQEIMAEAYAVGGASAQEMSSSMYQMIQALGSGILAGDELRSVREGAPLAYKAIEEFAQGVYDTTDSLKDMASEGMITADLVTAAIMSAGDEMDKAFAQTEQTFAQTWTQIKSAAVRAFKPISEMLSEALNDAVDNDLIKKVESVFANIAKSIMISFAVVGAVVNWIADNWDWLQYVIIFALTVITAYLLYMSYQAVATAVTTVIAWLAVNGSLLMTIIVIAAVIVALVYLAKQSEDLCDFLVNLAYIIGGAIILVLAVVLAAYIATGAVMLSIPTIIALAIIALIVLLLGYFIQFTGEIIGRAYGIWYSIKAICEWVNAAWQNMCNSMGSWFWNAIADMLDGCEWLLKGINKIREALGKDPISVENIRAKANEYASREKQALPSISDAWNTGYSKGYAIGEGIQNKINGFGDKIKNLGGGNLLDNIGEKLGLDFSGLTFPTDGVGDLSDELDKLLSDIGDNTANIADSMELTSEDVEYLRKIAAMEWKKEYTVADIKVDMSNYNTINNDSDLDGIVTKLSEKLYEELNEVADGVYAY